MQRPEDRKDASALLHRTSECRGKESNREALRDLLSLQSFPSRLESLRQRSHEEDRSEEDAEARPEDRSMKGLHISAVPIIATFLVAAGCGPKTQSFKASDPLFTGLLSPKNIVANIKTGHWTLGVYRFGERCRCGFVAYGKNDSLMVHDLGYDVGSTDSMLGYGPRHLQLPTIPTWVIEEKKRKGVDVYQDLTLVIIYEGADVVEGGDPIFVGFDGDPEHTGIFGHKTLYEESEREEQVTRYIKDQFAKLSYYRTTLPLKPLDGWQPSSTN